MAKITKSGKDTRSYSQRKRDEFDYRREYFKHNPGIFGCVWTCAYCHRPIVGKQNVQVDHIMPLNTQRFQRGSTESYLQQSFQTSCQHDQRRHGVYGTCAYERC